MRWLSIALVSAVFISGCATYPDAVKVADGTPLISYQSATQGKVHSGTARWSGVIAKVENNANNTRLEVVFFPGNDSGRPKISDQTEGRFVAYIAGFVDPMVYQQGKSVTVLGQLTQPETGLVDKFEYLYPVIQQAVVYLWPKQQDTRVDIVEPWPLWRTPYPYWGYGPAIRVRTTIPTGEKPAQGPLHVEQSSQGTQQR
jgi:outer membrane lipoprotein